MLKQEKSIEDIAIVDLLNVKNCMIVADAMRTQIETVEEIIEAKADYLLVVKENQSGLHEAIKEYAQDKDLQKTMAVYK